MMLSVLRKSASRLSVGAHSTDSVTALHDFHVAHGGKMVTFGGFRLPLQYRDQGVVASHVHTRTRASLFDVSHMLQTELTGAASVRLMETLCTADLRSLAVGRSTLSLFTDPRTAGILDDLIVTKIADDHLYVVSNAARRDHDSGIIREAVRRFVGGGEVGTTVRFLEPSERSLLALQGPRAAECLRAVSSRPGYVDELPFMASTVASVAGVETCRVTRCGYTGEDGFELSVPAIKTADVAEALLNAAGGDVCRPAGLAARDSLRLEAGLCLYGSDMDETVTPAEAGLMWLVAKRRRAARDFPGAAFIEGHAPAKRRIGLLAVEDGPPARHGTAIYAASDLQRPVGVVTSGCPSPTLGKNIAMGYVPTPLGKPGTELLFNIRNKFYRAVVTKMPFVKTNYYNKQN